MSALLPRSGPATGPGRPLRLGVLEALRSLRSGRGAVGLGLLLLPLSLAAEGLAHLVPALLQAAFGGALLLGLAPPSGSDLLAPGERGWARWSGGVTLAVLAAAVATSVLAVDAALGRVTPSEVWLCAGIAAGGALLAAALRQVASVWVSLLLAPVAIGGLAVALVAVAPRAASDELLVGAWLLSSAAVHALVSVRARPVTVQPA